MPKSRADSNVGMLVVAVLTWHSLLGFMLVGMFVVVWVVYFLEWKLFRLRT